MTTVTKESLAERIQHLEDLGSMISLNEEYQLAAYRMLIDLLPPDKWYCPYCQFEVDESDFADHECAACGAYLE